MKVPTSMIIPAPRNRPPKRDTEEDDYAEEAKEHPTELPVISNSSFKKAPSLISQMTTTTKSGLQLSPDDYAEADSSSQVSSS